MLGGIMRGLLLRRLLPAAILACGLVSSPHLRGQALNTNLIVNPGAEASAGAANFTDTAPPAGWTTTSNMTAVQYAVGGASDLNSADSTAIGGGKNYFSGGPQNGSSSATQTISLAGLASAIDSGGLIAKLSGYLGGFDNQDDSTTLTAVFRASGGGSLGSVSIGPVLSADRGNVSQLVFRLNTAAIPAGTRSVEITLVATQTNPAYNDGYADNLGFEVTSGGTPASGTFYWTNFGIGNQFGAGSFSWDGATLTVNTQPRATLPDSSLDGSLVVGADGNIYSGRAGSVFQMNPSTGTFTGVSSGVNNNVTSIDPARTTIYVGWKDSNLATLQTGSSFSTGTVHVLDGNDLVASGLAWDSSGTVWYTTGGENVLGNVGTIDLSPGKFITAQKLKNISATSITFDPFTGDLFTAGIDGIAQIDPATATVVSTWKNPQGTGQFIQNLSATGRGHLVAFDSSNLLRIWDFSSGSKLIGAADTIQATTGTTLTSAGLVLTDVVAGPPVITSPTAATATQGVQFFYQIIATGTPTSYSATPLPPGLSFDSSLGVISGEPTAGSFSITLGATNAAGTGNATLNLIVQVPPAAPIIVSSSAATARTGQPFQFQVVTTNGSAATRLTATGLPPGLQADRRTGLISGTPTTDGSYKVTLTVAEGAVSFTTTLEITVISDPKIPVIVSPNSALMVRGQAFNYTIGAPSSAGPSDPTTYAFIGKLPAGLGLDTTTGTISGTINARAPNSPNRIDLSGGIISNVQLFATNSHGTGTLPLIFYLAPSGPVNIATRLAVGTANDVLIAGFIITGNAPKKVIIRAIGPSLDFAGTLQDPTLELRDSSQSLGMNDNWRQTQENEIIATTIPPSDEREAAIIAILNPGNYTAIVGGVNNTTGIGVVEVYDLGTASMDISSNAKIAQISTRGRVQDGDNVMIGGFIIQGPPSKVIVRAIGPSLSGILPDALSDTVLELHDASGMIVASNDDWRSNQQQEIIDTTVPPSDDRESAIVATLSAGNYTGIVRGKDNAIGIGLVEVYSLQ